MIKFAAQFNKCNGPDGALQYKVEFTVDESQGHNLDWVMHTRKGTEFVITMIESGSHEAQQVMSETPEESRMRLKRRMEALISELANLTGKSAKEQRELVKQDLIAKGIIKESTNELDLVGFGRVAEIVQNTINEINPQNEDDEHD